MNHSCRPNCDVFHVGDSLNVFALRSISQGEEISISYEPKIRQMKSLEGRKELLFNEFGFQCQCPLCEEQEKEEEEEAEEEEVEEGEREREVVGRQGEEEVEEEECSCNGVGVDDNDNHGDESVGKWIY